MSFILDALKKSENERQGQGSLGVADVAVARENPRAPGWIWWLIGLLGINLIVLMVVLLRPADPGEPPAVEAAADSGETRSAVAASPDVPVTATSVRQAAESGSSVPDTVAPELAAVVDRARAERAGDPAADAADAITPPAVETIMPGAAPSDDASAPPPAPEPRSMPRNSAPQATEPLALPTLDELRARGATSLPELHVDIHVYSERPAERFVYINTRKYREGNELSEGPRVQTIVEEGVVLQHLGTRFLLPRE